MDYLISKIKPDDKEFYIINTSLYELAKLFGLNRSGKVYSDLTKSFRALRSKEVIIYNEYFNIAIVTGWLTQFKVSQTGQLTAQISEELAPYLLKLKETGHYTQHVLNDTIKLSSKYAIRLYKLMRESDKTKGKITSSITMTPVEFKELMNSPSSYSTGQFKQNILDKAIEQINKEIEDMHLVIDCQKKGRRIVNFTITNEFKSDTANEKYDEESPISNWLEVD